MAVKLSELKVGTMVEYNGEVFHSHKVIEMIKAGNFMAPMFLITGEWTKDILNQAYNDTVNNVDKESYSATNTGEEIEIDIYDCTCEGTMFTDSMCRTCLQNAKYRLNKKLESLEDQLLELESDLEQVEFHLDETEGVLLIDLLDQNEIVYTLNHEGVGFATQEEHEKAKKLAKEHGLTL